MDLEFKNKIKNLAKKINIDLTDLQVEKYYEYMNLLLQWNKNINLTAITDIDDIILKHFVDSMTILKYTNGKIIDVGTGAGFPGIPIAIMNNLAQVTLLDSLNKRILFLEDVKQKLDLKNVINIHGRVEEFAQKNREKYDIAVSRAVSNMTTLTEYLLPLIKTNGKAICMKGLDIEQELDDAKFAIHELGGTIEKIDSFILPESDITRNIIIIKKIKETPKKYPRKPGTPLRNPLKK